MRENSEARFVVVLVLVFLGGTLFLWGVSQLAPTGPGRGGAESAAVGGEGSGPGGESSDSGASSSGETSSDGSEEEAESGEESNEGDLKEATGGETDDEISFGEGRARDGEPSGAEKVRDAAFARARSEGKLVFLHFGSPSCGWCRKLKAFLSLEDVEPLLSKDYVFVEIDLMRMVGAREMHLEMRDGVGGGIPWFAVLDPGGEALATSDSPFGNIGFPTQPTEKEHFLFVLSQTADSLNPDETAFIGARLDEFNEELKRNRKE